MKYGCVLTLRAHRNISMCGSKAKHMKGNSIKVLLTIIKSKHWGHKELTSLLLIEGKNLVQERGGMRDSVLQVSFGLSLVWHISKGNFFCNSNTNALRAYMGVAATSILKASLQTFG